LISVGKTDIPSYWWAFLASLIVAVLVTIFVLVTGLNFISSIWELVNLLPSLAICVRRLRHGGRHWAWIFISLIPIVGWIILIYLLATSKK